ncbi:MAG: DUF3037 domain-containing protein [Bryobacteraceae bacterium]
MSGTTRGYYSIIQYCPDPSRLETVNVGVALFCPDIPYLQARFGRRKTPIRQVFGKQEWAFVEAQREALEARLKCGKEEFGDLESFEQFVAKRASAFRLTAPRFVKVEDPARELNSLFVRLVESRTEPKGSGEKIMAGMAGELESHFRAAGVTDRLRSGVTVQPPSFPKPFKAPFAYQNGRLNLIEPVEFEGHTPAGVFNAASVHAVEGRFLAEYVDPKLGALELVVVGKFAPDQEEALRMARRIRPPAGEDVHLRGSRTIDCRDRAVRAPVKEPS